MSARTERGGRVEFAPETLGPLPWLGAALAAVTGSIHLYLFYTQGFLPFLLAGLGFYGAVVLLLVLQGSFRLVLYAVGVPFVLAQLGGYYTVERPDSIGAMTTLAIIDKGVQIALVVLLLGLLVRAWRER